MKPVKLSLAAILLSASFAPAQPAAPLPGYTLAWSDEFDGRTLDQAKWNYRTDSKHWSTQLPGNVSVENGSLVLHLKKEKAGGKEYTGAGVISKQTFGYGYYETRFRVRAGKGWHTSFWMMKHDGSGGTGTGTADLELDAIENDSVDLTSYGVNTHKWRGDHVSVGFKRVTMSPLSEFHTFGCEYTPLQVRYFLDGAVVQTVDVTPFQQGPEHIWLTSIASSLGSTDAVDDSRLPGRVEYEYVRFYKPAPPRGATATKLPLNGEWRFVTDPQRYGETARWFDTMAEFRWDSVTVPHCWPVDPRYPYTGAAWYRRHFLTPEGWSGRNVRLHFEAVFYRTRVWVNGKPAGSHEGGYTPFELDVTRLLKPAGDDNLLAVEVDNSWDTTTLPGARLGESPEKSVYPWWDYGGIVRDVDLRASAPVYLVRQKVEALPDLSAGTAAIRAKVWVANTTAEAAEREISVAISRDGSRVLAQGTAKVRVAPLSEAVATFDLALPKGDVALWDLDHPNLYTFRSATGAETLENRFGIRRVEVRNARLLLNGEAIRLGGANRPADDPRYGLIEPEQVIERDFRLMKEAGLETGRHIHYAPAPAALDWADRNGMALILEAGNWQLAPEQMDSPVMRAKWQSQMREMMERDWNHPSVIGWSVGNEFLSNTPSGLRWVRDGRDFVRSLDSSRLVAFASNHAADATNRQPTDEASNETDLVMMNSYAHAESLGAALDRVHQLWPDKPVLISEHGIRADGVNVYGTPEKGDALAAQREYFRGFYATLRTRPWVCGASIWTFNDYRSRFQGTNADGYRWWGLVDSQRNKRPAYDWVRSELSAAVLGEAKLNGGAATIDLKTRADFPSYTLRGYRARFTWLDASGKAVANEEQALPDLPPGASRELGAKRPAGAAALRLEIVRPTGFQMTERRYELH
jgi:beta-glucuronidase